MHHSLLNPTQLEANIKQSLIAELIQIPQMLAIPIEFHLLHFGYHIQQRYPIRFVQLPLDHMLSNAFILLDQLFVNELNIDRLQLNLVYLSIINLA